MSGNLWNERDTTPSAVAGALEALLREGHADGSAHSPARALNLVVVADREWSGEVSNRLERVGRFHPSRTIAFAVEPERDSIDARVSITCPATPGEPAAGPCRERADIFVGPRHLPVLASVAAPILLKDLPTVVWCPHRHGDAIDSLAELADALLVDTLEEPSVERAIRGTRSLAERARVVDLTWLRDAPWRERIAALFDPPGWRRIPVEISDVTLAHAPGSGMASLLLVGWLGSQLGWKPRPLLRHDGTLYAKLRGRRQHVELRLASVSEGLAPGLERVAIATASGASVSLARHPGGFDAARRAPRDDERTWTILGAPPPEDRVLGGGIRQALGEDTTYEAALALTEGLLPSETLL